MTPGMSQEALKEEKNKRIEHQKFLDYIERNRENHDKIIGDKLSAMKEIHTKSAEEIEKMQFFDKISYYFGIYTSYLKNYIEFIILEGGVSQYINTSSNLLKTALTTTSNNIVSEINTIDSTRTSYILDTSNIISTKINNLTLDNIQNGVTKKFIVNNNYDNNLTITGKLTTNELLVLGDTFTINTTGYKTSNLNINTLLDGNDVGLKILSTYLTGNEAIFQINGVGTNNTITILGNGNVGIGNSVPVYALDVIGSVNISDNCFLNLLTNSILSSRSINLYSGQMAKLME